MMMQATDYQNGIHHCRLSFSLLCFLLGHRSPWPVTKVGLLAHPARRHTLPHAPTMSLHNQRGKRGRACTSSKAYDFLNKTLQQRHKQWRQPERHDDPPGTVLQHVTAALAANCHACGTHTWQQYTRHAVCIAQYKSTLGAPRQQRAGPQPKQHDPCMFCLCRDSALQTKQLAPEAHSPPHMRTQAQLCTPSAQIACMWGRCHAIMCPAMRQEAKHGLLPQTTMNLPVQGPLAAAYSMPLMLPVPPKTCQASKHTTSSKRSCTYAPLTAASPPATASAAANGGSTVLQACLQSRCSSWI